MRSIFSPVNRTLRLEVNTSARAKDALTWIAILTSTLIGLTVFV